MNKEVQQTEQITLPSHLFVELTSLKELNFLTNASTRIKFTCLSASPLYLAVGSSGGSVYLFSRYASKYRKSLSNVPLQVIPCKEGSVTALKISPNENKIAVASSRGFVFIVTIAGGKPSRTVTNVLHTGSEITALTWTRDSVRVYAGDSVGRLSCTRTGKTYFKSPCEIVLQLDSKIVQIDCYQFYVIVSTLSRCYLHDFARLTTVNVGKKLRSGDYGACFYYANEDSDEPVAFSARPGGRLWEVNCNGCVYNTHQFTTVKAPVAAIVESNCHYSFPKDLQSCSLSFSELYMICNQFLICINGSRGTVLDPRSASVVLFTSFEEEVVKYAVCGNDLFILTKDASLRKVTLFPYAKAVEKLQYRQCYFQSAQLIIAFLQENKECPWKVDFLKDILSHLDEEQEMKKSFALLVENVEHLKTDSSNQVVAKITQQSHVTKMSSGIHKVVKVMENSGYDDDFAFRAPASSSPTSTSPSRELRRNCQQLFNRRTRSGPLVTKLSHLVVEDECATINGEPSRLVDNDQQTTSTTRDHCRDDILLSSPRRVSPIAATSTMTSSRSEESLSTMLGVARQQISFQSPPKRNVLNNDCRAPKIVTSSSYKSNTTNGGAYANVVTSSPADDEVLWRRKILNEKKEVNHDGVDEDEDETPTPVAGTPTVEDYFCYEDFKSSTPMVYKELSSAPNVIVRRHRNGRSLSERKSNDITSRSSTSKDNMKINLGDISSRDKVREEKCPVLSPIDVAVFDTTYISTSENSNLSVCSNCNLHKSWHIFFRLYFFVKRLPFVSGHFNQGAIPTNVDDWTCLLNHWKSCMQIKNVEIVSSPKMTSSLLCANCKSLYDEWFESYSKSSTIFGPFKEVSCGLFSNRNSSTATTDTEFQWAELDKNLVESLFFSSRSIVSSTKNDATMTSSSLLKHESQSCSMYYNPLYDSCYEPSTTPATSGGQNNNADESSYSGDDDWLKAFGWIYSDEVALDLLICCARKTLRDQEFEILLSGNSWINTYLSVDFYRFLLRHENDETVSSSISDALLLDVLNTDVQVNALKDEVQHLSPQPFTFDICKNCPCCTLSILAKVTETEGTVIVFRCGHTFHRVCLSNTGGSSETGQSSYTCLICCIVDKKE